MKIKTNLHVINAVRQGCKKNKKRIWEIKSIMTKKKNHWKDQKIK